MTGPAIAPSRLFSHPLTLRFLFVAMECAWIAGVLGLADGAASTPDTMPLSWVVALYPAAWLYESALERLRVPPVFRLALHAILGLLAVVATASLTTGVAIGNLDAWADLLSGEERIRSALLSVSLISGLSVLVRGGILAHRAMDAPGFAVGFQVGLGVLMLAAFIGQAVETPVESLIRCAGLFLALGLFGLWLARWQSGKGTEHPGARAGWPIVVLAAITVIIFAGWLMSTVLDEHFMRMLLSPIFWLWDLLGRILLWLIHLLPKPEYGPLPESGLPRLPSGNGKAPPLIDFGATMSIIGKVMFYGSVGTLLFLALLRNILDLIRWLSRRKPGSRGIAFSHSSANFFSDLKEIFRALLEALSHALHLAFDRLFKGPYADLPHEIRTVRLSYRRLLAWARRRGYPRAPGQTPFELLGILSEAYPDRAEALAFMTETYVSVRYRGARPEPESMRKFLKSWRHVRRLMRKADFTRSRET